MFIVTELGILKSVHKLKTYPNGTVKVSHVYHGTPNTISS